MLKTVVINKRVKESYFKNWRMLTYRYRDMVQRSMDNTFRDAQLELKEYPTQPMGKIPSTQFQSQPYLTCC